MVASEDLIIPFKESGEKLETADKLTEDDKSTFKDKTFDTVILKEGMILHRFISEKHYNPFSNCWIDHKTFTEMINYFQHAESLSSRARKEYIRNQLAILKDWNKLNYRVKIALKKDIIAYVGPIEVQKVVMEFNSVQAAFEYKNSPKNKNFKKEKVSEYRIGGFKQYFIPRLKNKSVRGNDNEYAKILHSAHL